PMHENLRDHRTVAFDLEDFEAVAVCRVGRLPLLLVAEQHAKIVQCHGFATAIAVPMKRRATPLIVLPGCLEVALDVGDRPEVQENARLLRFVARKIYRDRVRGSRLFDLSARVVDHTEAILDAGAKLVVTMVNRELARLAVLFEGFVETTLLPGNAAKMK